MRDPSAKSNLPAKVVAPQVQCEPRRKRLEPPSSAAACWIDGPPGAGKSMLAAAMLAGHAGYRMWLRIDAADAAPANFFHFLRCAAAAAGIAAERLPRFSAEYAGDPTLFAQRFLHACSQSGDWCLVLDQVEAAAPAAAPLAVVTAAETAPTAGSRVIVTSRLEPPPELARLRINGQLACVDGHALRLNAREAKLLAHRLGAAHSPAAIERWRALSRGWVAGFRVLLEVCGPDAGPEAGAATPATVPRVLVDYLDAEFLECLPEETRALLGRLAPLGSVSQSAVMALAGRPGIDRLEGLVARHGFVTRETAGDTVRYRIDPLLCRTIENRLARTLDAEIRRRWHAETAAALAAAHELEAAVDEWLAAGDHERAAAAIARLAPDWIDQGRHQAAADRLERLPPAVREADPWLLLWAAEAKLPRAPAQARARLYPVYRRFREDGQTEGAALAWAAMAESMWLEWGDFGEVAWLLDELAWLAAAVAVASARTRARVVPAALLLTAVVQPQRRSILDHWLDTADRTRMESGIPADRQLAILHILLALHVWLRGERGRGENLLAHGRRLEATVSLPPIDRLMWRGAVAGHHLWFADDPRMAVEEAERGLALARDTGVHLWDFQLHSLAAGGALAAADEVAAEQWRRCMDACGRPDRPLDASFHAWINGWAAMLRGDPVSARARAMEARDLLAAGGPWNAVSLARLGLARAERAAGNAAAAAEQALRVRVEGRARGARIHRWLAALLRAELLLDAGALQAARRVLRVAMAFGEREGLRRLPWWNREDLASLCNEALCAGASPGYVRRLATGNGQHLWSPSQAVAAWPWPVRIQVLDNLRVLVDGQSVDIAGKGAELLTLLAAAGGHSVDAAQLTDQLWPDAEGDRARRSLDTTLHRLRQRLGRSDIIRMTGGRLELDPALVWTDVRALEAGLQSVEKRGEAAWVDVERLLRSLQGPAAHWPGRLGQQLRQRLVRNAERALEARLKAGRPESVIDSALLVLSIDASAESVCQQGLHGAQRVGDAARARELYAQCRVGLAAAHGGRPCAHTDELFRLAADEAVVP